MLYEGLLGRHDKRGNPDVWNRGIVVSAAREVDEAGLRRMGSVMAARGPTTKVCSSGLVWV